MQVKLHQDVLGRRSGDTVTVDATQAEWLLREGYASVEGDDTDKHLVTTVDAQDDPTLGANAIPVEETEQAVLDAEDAATNDEESKRADVEAAAPADRGTSTQKRPGKGAQESTATADEPSEG